MMKYRRKDFYIFRAKSLLGELKAFSATISSMTSVSGFLNLFPKPWIAFSNPHIWPKQCLKVFPRFLRSDFLHWVIDLAIIRLRNSPISIGRTPEFWSRGIRRHELYAVRFS